MQVAPLRYDVIFKKAFGREWQQNWLYNSQGCFVNKLIYP
jgi:hypothetical protein